MLSGLLIGYWSCVFDEKTSFLFLVNFLYSGGNNSRMAKHLGGEIEKVNRRLELLRAKQPRHNQKALFASVEPATQQTRKKTSCGCDGEIFHPDRA